MLTRCTLSDHVWQAKSPYKHNGLVTSKTYTTQGKAVAAIMKSKGKYKGFTRISAGKYQVRFLNLLSSLFNKPIIV